MDKSTLVSLLKENGIVGAGGAGFPTYAKIDERAETIIMNCCECEPLLKLHRQLLEKDTREILNAFEVIRETVGAKEAVIGIKEAYVTTVQAIKQIIGEFPHIRIAELEEVYPAGDEVVLIYEVTKKVVRPGGLPIESGIAVFNVETVYNLAQAMKGKPVTEKLVSVVAEVNRPVTVRVPIGMPLQEVVSLAGGSTIKDPVYLVGGPMMGRILPPTETVTKTTNAILVLPPDHYLIERKLSNNKINLKRAAASCCQCSMCTDLCPRHLLGHPIEPHLLMRAAICKDIQHTEAFVNTFFCCGCGLCELYSCFQGLAPRTLIQEVKNGLRAAGVKPPVVQAAPVSPAREGRKAPIERLMARIDLSKYDRPAPLEEDLKPCREVRILLSQHIGAPAVPVVRQGDRVSAGIMIAQPGNGLSVAIHASIDGMVTQVTDKYIRITQN